MGSDIYPISDTTHMSVVSRFKNKVVTDKDGKGGLSWGELKKYSTKQNFYSARFVLQDKISPDRIGTGKTTFLNPKNKIEKTITPSYSLDRTLTNVPFKVEGPVNVGPNVNGYGIGMSESLMKLLEIHEGEVVYFTIN